MDNSDDGDFENEEEKHLLDFFKWRPEILHEIEYLVFHNYFVFFGKKRNQV
jgi:hypothetical protein